MADIPIPSGIPQMAVRKEEYPDTRTATRAYRAQGEFGNALSDIGLKFYTLLKHREAADQLDRAQNDTVKAYMNYRNWVRQNPNEPDIELNKFNEHITQSQNSIKQYLKNGVAQREFNSWFNEKKTFWADNAMERAYTVDTAIKRSQMFADYDTILQQDMSGLTEDEMLEMQDEIEKILIDGINTNLWQPDEVVDDLNSKIIEGRDQVKYNWYKTNLVKLSKEDYEEVIKSGVDLTTEQIKSIKAERDLWQKIAEEQLEIETEKTEQDWLVKLRTKELFDTDIINSNLNVDKKQEWLKYVDAQVEEIRSGKDIITDERVKGDLESMAYDIFTGAISIPDFHKKLRDVRYIDKSINDAAYDELFSLGQREFKSYQAKAIQTAIDEAAGQLIDVRSEEDLAAMLANLLGEDRQSVIDDRKIQLWNHSQYRRALNVWISEHPDADADEIYIQGRKLLAHYRKPTEQIREELLKEEKILKGESKEKINPTAEELRAKAKTITDKEERRKIFEQGKKLGYWE